MAEQEYPTTVAQQLKDKVEAEYPDLAVRFYAGEFFDEEQIQKLQRDVKIRPVVFIDIESIFPVEDRKSSSHKESTDQIIFQLFCSASNVRSESDQILASAELANKMRKTLVGENITAVSGVHSNAVIQFLDIEKQFSIFGLSVHRLDVFVNLPYNLDS